ncbi:MAG: hypothetical protein J5625_01145 [Lachnospiraceae bacterium]|nr:hypothetical protein [Lachnospiraceae bacterium]
MSKAGLKAALLYGSKLKSFNSISDAKEFYFTFYNRLKDEFIDLCKENEILFTNYSVESLKDLEKWYFELLEEDKFESIGISREEFEQCMGVYFAEVVVQNNKDASLIVEEFPFVPGKYNMVVNKGLASMTFFGLCVDWYSRTGNKRRTLLFREYNKYFS